MWHNVCFEESIVKMYIKRMCIEKYDNLKLDPDEDRHQNEKSAQTPHQFVPDPPSTGKNGGKSLKE